MSPLRNVEAWRQNILNILSLDLISAHFLLEDTTLLRKSSTQLTRGVSGDGDATDVMDEVQT